MSAMALGVFTLIEAKFKSWKWQDAIFSAGEIVFLLSLFPSVLGDHKPAAATSFATALMLYLFLFVHASYKLWVAFCLTAITATLWMVMGFQVIN